MPRSSSSAVRPLEPGDFPALRRLFLSFPYKSAQHRFQSLDEKVLAHFFTEAEKKRLEEDSGDRPTQWTGWEKGELAAFAALHADSWHSRFYDLRFGRIAPFLTHRASPALRARLLGVLLENARAAGFNHLIARIDGSEFAALKTLQDAGFYLVDCSVKMSALLDAVPRLAPPSRAASMRIRPFRPEDLETLQSIVSVSHPLNHYYNDPCLGRARTDQLFQAWVARCCALASSRVFVLDHRGKPRGFAIYLDPSALNEAAGTRLIILDLVCLDRKVRGGGLGRWLLSDTLRGLSRGFSLVELRTSQNNYPALSCYADLGMRVVSTDFILHRHAEDE